jgi:hypothetical protein
VALVEQVLRTDLLERPPDRLDVARVERAVGVVEVEPEADPLGQAVPLLEELEHRLAAAVVELGDPELLDLLLLVIPSSRSTSISTGSPWQSQPPLRSTL